MREPEREYEQITGHPPVTLYPADHPGFWEWKYKGTAQEREQLLELLQIEAEAVSADQEALF